jgi:hypothetical protein
LDFVGVTLADYRGIYLLWTDVVADF